MTENSHLLSTISDAVMRGRGGDTGGAKTDLADIWNRIVDTDDLFHRCVLAHYMADLHEPVEALIWDELALAAAIEEHLDALVISTTEARRNAADIIADLPTASTSEVLTSLRGYILAEALDQVLTATVREPGIPVLESVLMEVDSEAVTFVATDRYRLVVRTIAAASDLDEPRSFILNGDDLRDVAATMRRDPVVHLVASVGGIDFTEPVESRRLSCRTVSEVFPDYRLMLDHLAEPTARPTLPLTDLLHRVNEADGDRFTLDGEETVTFALTTLYPALTSAIGPEVMLEIRGPEQPVTIRSADRGDLTVVVMPVKP